MDRVKNLILRDGQALFAVHSIQRIRGLSVHGWCMRRELPRSSACMADEHITGLSTYSRSFVIKSSTSVRVSMLAVISFSIFSYACLTVVWSLLP